MFYYCKMLRSGVHSAIVLVHFQIHMHELKSPKCYVVEQGDIIGLFIKTIPSPITYVQNFDNPNTLRKQFDNDNDYPQIGDVITMDTLNFPYQFSFYMSIDIGDIGGNNGGNCSYFNKKVRDYLATLPQVTTEQAMNLVRGPL